MITDLLKPSWKSRSVEKRRQAIVEMDNAVAENQEILFQLASDDEDDTVKIAAIRQLTSAVALHELSLKLPNNAVCSEAENRVNELLGMTHLLDEAQYRDLLNRFPELQLRVAAFAELSSVRTETIQSLSRAQLLEVLGLTAYTDSRQLISETLSDIEDLEAARKIMRGKDKNAERIIKAKIGDIRSHERQQVENLARVAKLIEEVEYLSDHDWLPEFKVRCQTHRKQWDSLTFDIDDEARQRYQVARDIVDTAYEQQLNVEQTRQAYQQLVSELETLLQVTAARDLGESVETLSESQSQLQQIGSTWQDLFEITPPDKFILDRYDKILGALHSATRLVAEVADLVQETMEDPGPDGDIDRLSRNSQQAETALKNLEWPAEFTELKTATELRQRLVELGKAQKASADANEQKLARAHKNISSAFRFSRAGNLARAQQYLVKAEKALGQFDGKDLLNLQERFDEASKKLADMGDWKNFVTEPKYVELCEAMESLAASKHHPDKLSGEMKALQQKWKAIGHSDISGQYWPRFKLATDKVYQPCAEFFKQRNEIRKSNLEQRGRYLEQMQELLEATDWDDNPDYKAAQSRMRKIIDSFTSIKEVERNAGQKQWRKLSKYRDGVNAKLEVAYEANIALKQQLIRQTEALAEAPAKDENLATLKILQTRWKQIGITRRSQDQKAWAAFKKQGDIVYKNLQALRREQRDVIDQQLNAYREIIKAIKKLAKTTIKPDGASQQFSILQESYAALPELPRQLPEKLVAGIQRDYRNACDQYEDSHARIVKDRHRSQIDALRTKADLCAQQEALGASPSEQELKEISQQWDAIELPNAEYSRRIEARRDTAQSDLDRDAIGEERRQLCIQLEIAMGVDSPAEDAALRMQYQLEQMKKSGLGQQSFNRKELLENMELEWLFMPGAEAEQQKLLDERFQRVLRSA